MADLGVTLDFHSLIQSTSNHQVYLHSFQASSMSLKFPSFPTITLVQAIISLLATDLLVCSLTLVHTILQTLPE